MAITIDFIGNSDELTKSIFFVRILLKYIRKFLTSIPFKTITIIEFAEFTQNQNFDDLICH